MTASCTELPTTGFPDQLWPGDHVRLDGRDALFSEMKNPWIYNATGKWHDGHMWVFTDDRMEMIQLERIETFERVAIPEARFTDQPFRGEFFWGWYTQAEPSASMFWDLTGPFKDGTYTIRCVNLYDLARHTSGSRRVVRPGWVNGMIKQDGLLLDNRGAPVPFFMPSFMPDSLRLTSRELAYQPRLL